jgi:hypothetical protein
MILNFGRTAGVFGDAKVNDSAYFKDTAVCSEQLCSQPSVQNRPYVPATVRVDSRHANEPALHPREMIYDDSHNLQMLDGNTWPESLEIL